MDKTIQKDKIKEAIHESSELDSAYKDEVIKALLEDKVITKEQLEYAVRVQTKLETRKRITEVLKYLKYISEADIIDILRKNKAEFKIGRILLELGFISDGDLENVLRIQKDTNSDKRIGQLLIEQNYISEEDLINALSLHLGYKYVNPVIKNVELPVLANIPPETLENNLFYPVVNDATSITIVVNDPQNEMAISAAKSFYGKSIEVALAPKHLILEAIEYYKDRVGIRKPKKTPENEAIAFVDNLIKKAIQEGISDIHIEPSLTHLRIRLRKDGILHHYKDLPMEFAPPITNRIKIMANANIAEKRRHQDGRILLSADSGYHQIDIRCSFYATIFGDNTVMRILNKQENILDLTELGFTPKTLEHFKSDALDLPTGVIIITGPTGSGKTTTLYSSIQYCKDPTISIVTVEDPVEYVIDGITQCSINPKIGLTFEESLKHIVRQDPDIIVLGEIRDKLSAETAIQAALTGHKVFTTFHTEDSIGGLLRLMNFDIEAFLISSTVVCVVAQRLVRKNCSKCNENYEVDKTLIRRLGYRSEDIRDYKLMKGKGCKACNYSGYKGRIGVYEILILNDPVKEAILRKKTSGEIRRICMESSSLVTLTEDGLAKALMGLTTIEEVLKHLPRVIKPRPVNEIFKTLGVAKV